MAELLPPKSNPDQVTKMLLIGDSSSGKTGALASLVGAGYELFILDYDCKVEKGFLPHAMQRDNLDFSKVHYEALRDEMKATPTGFIPAGTPKAHMQGTKLMETWTDGTKPKDWGPKKILVIDSLTFLSDAAFNYVQAMNPGCKDPRQWYAAAQRMVEDTISYVTGASFNTNVIIISHVSWVERPDGTMKGYPSSVGKALGPTIPAYFDTLALAEVTGTGANTKRIIRTASSGLIDLKNPASFRMQPSLPLESGLATFFETLRN